MIRRLACARDLDSATIASPRRAARSARQIILSALFLLASVLSATPLMAEESGLYWIIEKDGEKSGYLLGTIHSEDARVLDFSPALLGAMEEIDTFAMELVPDLPTLAKLARLMNYDDDTTLESVLGEELYAQVISRLSAYNLPEFAVRKMKPWAAAMTLMVPPPETGIFMDFSLSLRAAAQGATVTALETLETQVGFLENLPLADQIYLIRDAVTAPDKSAEQYADMMDTYLAGDLTALETISREQLKTVPEHLARYIQEAGIDQRNRQMVEALIPLIEKELVFVAVGALHLPGEMGLIQLLREQGYTLTPSPDPALSGERP